MPDQVDRDVVADVSRQIVAEVAPDELPLFSVNSQAYFKNPKKALESSEGADDALGFGVELLVPLLTPIVLSVVTEVVNHLTQSLSQQLAGKAEQLVGALFKRPGATAHPAPVLQLSPAQLSEVRSIAFTKARQLKLPEAEAALLADSVIGSLAVTPVS